jgi:hypothetical protein
MSWRGGDPLENITIYVLIGAAGTVCSIIFGFIGYQRGLKKEVRTDTEIETALKTDMEYLKRGVDDIRFEQRSQGQRIDAIVERVTRVEESSKQAHKRIDRIEHERS